MPEQQQLNFDRVGHQQWECLREYLDDRVIPDYLTERGQQKKYLAADLGLSPSSLRRKLVPTDGDTSRFTVDDLERWLDVTGDLKPIFYLLEKYSGGEQDELDRLRARVAELEGRSAKVVSNV